MQILQIYALMCISNSANKWVFWQDNHIIYICIYIYTYMISWHIINDYRCVHNKVNMNIKQSVSLVNIHGSRTFSLHSAGVNTLEIYFWQDYFHSMLTCWLDASSKSNVMSITVALTHLLCRSHIDRISLFWKTEQYLTRKIPIICF